VPYSRENTGREPLCIHGLDEFYSLVPACAATRRHRGYCERVAAIDGSPIESSPSLHFWPLQPERLAPLTV
jgi:hypothetical protein